jgi:hypothetical protein
MQEREERDLQRQFAMVADLLKKEFEPEGFHVQANSNNQTIVVTDVLGQFEWKAFVVIVS